MVMEATPSPQSVGREFVRQYYTLLNKAPEHLHRFYNSTSVFVHGGLDTASRDTSPAIGQIQIHQKIQQLNFQDCHAKINQVDSQATLGDGVVVQVSGELSNAGQPMRRFTQTFVLAAQAPKQYYVHNDIFRYQDFGYPDEEDEDLEGVEGVNEAADREGEEGCRSENEDDVQQNQAQISGTITTSTEQHNQPPLITPQQASLPQPQQLYYPAMPQQAVHQVMQPVTINGSVHEESPLMNQQSLQQQQLSQPQQQQQQQPPQQHQYISDPSSQEQFTQETELDSVNDQSQQVKEEPQTTNEELHEQPEGETFTSTAPEVDQGHSLTTSTNTNSSGPKTYANLVKSFPSTAGATSPQTQKLSMSPPPMTNLRLDERSPLHPQGSGPTLSTSNINPAQQQAHRLGGSQPTQTHQQYQQQRPPRSGPMQRDGDRRGGRPATYNDSHQLFVGKLPPNASESELRQVFERFGKVTEFRIHNKPNERSKGPQGSNNTTGILNYGFVTFEDHQSVTKVLLAGSIYFPDENGHKLNIEEKRPKTTRGQMEGSGRPNLGDGNMRPMGQQQQQRGPGGPGGIMRGGPSTRGVRAGFSRGNDSRGGSMRQPGNPNNSSYPNRR